MKMYKYCRLIYSKSPLLSWPKKTPFCEIITHWVVSAVQSITNCTQEKLEISHSFDKIIWRLLSIILASYTTELTLFKTTLLYVICIGLLGAESTEFPNQDVYNSVPKKKKKKKIVWFLEMWKVQVSSSLIPFTFSLYVVFFS